MANGGLIQRSASTPVLRSAPRGGDSDLPVVAPLAPLRRRPSAISLEKHGSFIFDEINSLLEDGSGSTGGEHNDGDMIDREVRPPASGGLSSRRMSELSLDSFDCPDDDDDRDGEDPARHGPQESPQEEQQEERGVNIPQSPGRRIVEQNQQHHFLQVPIPTVLARSASAPVSSSRYCNNNRVSLLTRIEQRVIEKGIRDGKLVRTSSHVSFRGSTLRRRRSVSVIQEDRELSNDRMVQAWADDDDDTTEETAIAAPDFNTLSLLNDDVDDDDSDALFF